MSIRHTTLFVSSEVAGATVFSTASMSIQGKSFGRAVTLLFKTPAIQVSGVTFTISQDLNHKTTGFFLF